MKTRILTAIILCLFGLAARAADEAPWALGPRATEGGTTLRRAGRLHHLEVGAARARTRVPAIVGEEDVTVVALDTGEILPTHRIEPGKGSWRHTRRDPGR